jgi:RNA polymerase sigma-70 factor, ECF subfamily
VATLLEASLTGASRSPSVSQSRRTGPTDLPGTFAAELDQLFHQRFPALYRYINRLAGDGPLAEDIAQDAFLRLYDRGEMPDEPIAWLITVATNLLRDDRRRTGRRLRLMAAAEDDVGRGAAPPDPEASVVRSERRRQVRHALERLSLRDRHALLLRHAGFSYREIAVALDMAEASVGTTLLRAGAAFRASYEELHGKPD